MAVAAPGWADVRQAEVHEEWGIGAAARLDEYAFRVERAVAEPVDLATGVVRIKGLRLHERRAIDRASVADRDRNRRPARERDIPACLITFREIDFRPAVFMNDRRPTRLAGEVEDCDAVRTAGRDGAGGVGRAIEQRDPRALRRRGQINRRADGGPFRRCLSARARSARALLSRISTSAVFFRRLHEPGGRRRIARRINAQDVRPRIVVKRPFDRFVGKRKPIVEPKIRTLVGRTDIPGRDANRLPPACPFPCRKPSAERSASPPDELSARATKGIFREPLFCPAVARVVSGTTRHREPPT